MTVYVDLDGVLADFDAYAKQLWPDACKEFGICGSENPTKLWDIIQHQVPDFYAHLPVMEDAFLLWEFLKPYSPKILTAIPSLIHLPQCTKHKRDWVHTHFGAHVDVLFGPFSVDKQFHCKTGDILIDDKPLNISQWFDRGGIGFLHTSAVSTILDMEKVGFK
jgi:hypothetical protein